MWRSLPNAENLAEFTPAPSGEIRYADCGELMLLGALHCLEPGAYPLTGAALNAINVTMQSHGWAARPEGAAAPPGIRAFLQSIGEPFAEYPTSQLANILHAYAGLAPILTEYANAEAFAGDERNLHYHYHATVAGDPDTDHYADVDGDSLAVRISRGEGPLYQTTLAEMERAQPYWLAVLTRPLLEAKQMLEASTPEVARYFTAQPDGSWRCENGMSLSGAILDYYRTIPAAFNGLTLYGLPLSAPLALVGNAEVQPFERGGIVYDPQRAVDDPPGVVGECYPAHLDRMPLAAFYGHYAPQTSAPAPAPQRFLDQANVDALRASISSAVAHAQALTSELAGIPGSLPSA